ncbi:MAG TPA: hypothetical protein VGB18_03330 [Candidatus Thermoplasmatota archaeon]
METVDPDEVDLRAEEIRNLAGLIMTLDRRALTMARVQGINKRLGRAFQDASQDRVAGLRIRRERLRSALADRNEYWNQEYHEAGLAAQRVWVLATLLLVGILGVLVLAGRYGLPVLGDDGGSRVLLVGVAVFSLLGGAASSLFTVATGSYRSVLAPSARQAPWYFARPLFGAASALIASAIIASDGFGLTATSDASYLAIGAIAGFSEIFFHGLVARFGSRRAQAAEEDAQRPSRGNA